jgi:hypothetical protein
VTVKKAADLAVVRIKDEALKFADENKAKLDEVFAHLGQAEKEIERFALRGATQKVVIDAKRELMERGDALAESSITPEKIESLPWRNLLAAADAGKWGKGGTCEFKIENGVLTITGPPADSKDQGVVGIAEDEGIRDFVLEAKVSIKGRGFSVMWRKEPEGQKMGTLSYHTEGIQAVPENTEQTLKIEARGQTGVVTLQPADLRQPFKMGPEKARKGGFGFSADPESVLTISEIKIKVIR